MPRLPRCNNTDGTSDALPGPCRPCQDNLPRPIPRHLVTERRLVGVLGRAALAARRSDDIG